MFPQPIYDWLRYFSYKFFNYGYFALNDLDKKLEKYLDYQNGYFVELGANDGFTQSNTLAFENKKGWRGVLIEPSPHLFLSCCHFRAKKGNSIYCNACVPFDYKEKYVDIDYANLMSTSTSLSSDIDDIEAFHKSGKKDLKGFAKTLRFGAEARTLTSILDASKSPLIIDFLSLDVEGAELAVLSGIDFGKYKFKFILVECRDIFRLKAFLGENQYSFIEQLSNHDYLFAHNSTNLSN
jgi:FkbM family methyltransferase